jgi:tRNA 2-thiouridine synthesizing protein D
MANISLLVMSAPTASQNAQSALRFAQTVAKSEHNLSGIFFYLEGVYNANCLQINVADETSLFASWCALAEDYSCPLLVCVTAASKRGILSEVDAQDNDIHHFNLKLPFQSVGLGEFAKLLHASDRLIQF